MMDPQQTKAKNEIMRGIKLHQIQHRNLPNFIRKKREEILNNVSCLHFNLFYQRVHSMELRVEDNTMDARNPQGKTPKMVAMPQIEQADNSQLREEFVDYVKDILTKTTGAA